MAYEWAAIANRHLYPDEIPKLLHSQGHSLALILDATVLLGKAQNSDYHRNLPLEIDHKINNDSTISQSKSETSPVVEGSGDPHSRGQTSP